MAVPKLGTTTTTEYSFTKAICQSTGGWLFCRSISLPLTSGLAVGRDGAGLSSHIVGAFELLGQAQYPQERREVLRGNLLKGYLQLIAELVDQHFCIAALSYGLLKFFLHIIQRGLRVGDDDDKIRLNQRKPSKYKGLSRFGPEKNLQRINKFMKERPTFYKKLIQMKENFRFYLRCFYCITKVVILQFNSEKQDRISS